MMNHVDDFGCPSFELGIRMPDLERNDYRATSVAAARFITVFNYHHSVGAAQSTGRDCMLVEEMTVSQSSVR